jgi:hypothetical protein
MSVETFIVKAMMTLLNKRDTFPLGKQVLGANGTISILQQTAMVRPC